MTVVISRLKKKVAEAVDSVAPELQSLSRQIHDNPELAFKEYQASGLLVTALTRHGYTVKSGLAGLETAFKATYGQGKPVIAFFAEYDALPGIGHACGHNIICTAAIGAAIAAKAVADTFGCTIRVIGTPGEELFGGKALMAERGVFADVDAAMLVHPGTKNAVISHALACHTLDVEYFGKSAHAAAAPEEGINALDAMLVSFNAMSALRQHIKDTARVHGVITDGGEAPNIVPAHSAASIIVRAVEDSYLDSLKERVLACFEAGARATGARLEYKWGEARYAAMKNNQVMGKLFYDNMARLRGGVVLEDAEKSFGSTDMGNVSQVVPAIHPFVAVAPPDVQLHTPEFAAAALSEEGFSGLMHAAKAMVMTAADLAEGRGILARVSDEFNQSAAG
ncbi:M20 family metallopeptidase [Chloroflexota bacterium]